MHVALTVLVCARYQHVQHWSWYVVWNVCAIAVILLLARNRRDGGGWEFAHDWLPAVFFITVFEEVSFLSLSLRSGWNDRYLAFAEALLFNGHPVVWMHSHAAPWLIPFMEFRATSRSIRYTRLWEVCSGRGVTGPHLRPRFAG